MTHQHIRKVLGIILAAALLPGCDQVSERAGFPAPERVEAEGKAIGGACRHAGRGLEDCYRLNETAAKSAVYAGWKEMNEYMVKNNMQSVTPTIPPELLAPPEPVKKKKAAAEDENAADADPEASKTKKKKSAEDESTKDAAEAPAKEH
jgi:cell division septation protein DedD